MRFRWKLAQALTLTPGGRHPVRDLSNFNLRVTSYDCDFSNTISAAGINLRNYGRLDHAVYTILRNYLHPSYSTSEDDGLLA